MSKFKVGDKVVRKQCQDDALFKRHLGDCIYYTITDMTTHGHWLQLNHFYDDYDRFPWYAANFELYQEPDDELPPVPASVAYMNSKRDRGNDQRLVLERCSWTDENLLYIGIVPKKNSTRAEQEIGINMSPDAALQLAHDLRRMAMDIRREGRDGRAVA